MRQITFIIYTLRQDVQKLSRVSHVDRSLKTFFSGWPICLTLCIPGWSAVSDRSLGAFAMEMRRKQQIGSPQGCLCMLALSSGDRNVWMVDNYQRTKVTLLLRYLGRMTTHYSSLSNRAGLDNVMSCMESVHHTFESYFLPLAKFPVWSVPPADGRTGLFMMRIWLQWPFVQEPAAVKCYKLPFWHTHAPKVWISPLSSIVTWMFPHKMTLSFALQI